MNILSNNEEKIKGSDVGSRFTSGRSEDGVVGTSDKQSGKKGKDGRTVIPMYSEFFSNMTGNMMVTANKYEILRTEIQSVIASRSIKEKILLKVYANSNTATELDMEGLIVGFRRFISENRRRALRNLRNHFLCTFGLFIFGTLLKYLLLAFSWFEVHALTASLVDILAELTIWQFAAFAAIDLVGEVRKIRRLSQIEKTEFVFRRWE